MSCAVYRCLDAGGVLLYVGISSVALQRLAQHDATKAWFREVVTISVEHYADRAQAVGREAELIRTLHPRYNKQDNYPRYSTPYTPLIPGPSGKTHCIHGHRYDSVNTIVNKGGARQCRQCKRLRLERQRSR